MTPAGAARAAAAIVALGIAATAAGAAAAEPAAVAPHLLVQTDAVVARHGPEAPEIADGVDHTGIYLRRARAGVDAGQGVWRGRLVIEASSTPEIAEPAAAAAAATGTETGTEIDAIAGELTVGATRGARPTEAFVALATGKGFALAAGALRVPIGRSRRIAEGDLRLPERARVITRGTPDFRAGVAAGGDLGLLQYDAGVFSAASTLGSGRTSFADAGALFVARLGAEPVGPIGDAPQLRAAADPWSGWWRLAAGLTAIVAVLPGANELGLDADGAFQWGRFLLTGELLWTRRAGADRLGFYVEPGVFVWRDRLELVARAEWLNESVGPPSPADAWGASLGATFYSFTRVARLQAAYTLRRPTGGGADPSGWATLRATFVL